VSRVGSAAARKRSGVATGHRTRLGLPGGELGLLLGVSTQTICNWESGKARPHRRYLTTLVALRTVGKKQTLAHFEEVEKAA